MSLADEINAMIEDMESKHSMWKQRAQEAAERRFSEASERVYSEFGDYQQNKITSLFNDAISSFYRAYQPKIYTRTNSMYDLLRLPLDEKNLVDYNTTLDLIDRNMMHEDRSGGNSLFETVFMEGWHGGAKSINASKEGVWGKHPNPGVAYYRRSGMVKYPDNPKPKRHRYGKWGRVAFRSESPYRLFDDSLVQAENSSFGQTFQEISQKNWDILCNDLQSDLTTIQRDIYG